MLEAWIEGIAAGLAVKVSVFIVLMNPILGLIADGYGVMTDAWGIGLYLLTKSWKSLVDLKLLAYPQLLAPPHGI